MDITPEIQRESDRLQDRLDTLSRWAQYYHDRRWELQSEIERLDREYAEKDAEIDEVWDAFTAINGPNPYGPSERSMTE